MRFPFRVRRVRKETPAMSDRRVPRESRENPANPDRKANGENPDHRDPKGPKAKPDRKGLKVRKENEAKPERHSESMLPVRWKTAPNTMMRQPTSASSTRIPGVFT